MSLALSRTTSYVNLAADCKEIFTNEAVSTNELNALASKITQLFKTNKNSLEVVRLARNLLTIKNKLVNPVSNTSDIYRELVGLNAVSPLEQSSVRSSNVFAMMLEAEAHKPNPSLSLQRGLKILCKKVPVTTGWLSQLLPKGQPSEVTRTLFEQILDVGGLKAPQRDLVRTLYARLLPFPVAACSLDDSEKLVICLFTAIILRPATVQPPKFYPVQQYGLPRGLQHDITGIHIHLKNQVANPAKISSEIEFNPCIHLFYDSSKSVEFSLQRVHVRSRPDESSSAFSSPEYGLIATSQQIEEGLWPMYSSCEYREGKIRKTSVTAPYGREYLFSQKTSATNKERLEVARQLCSALSSMHRQNMVFKNFNDTRVFYQKMNEKIQVGFLGELRQIVDKKDLSAEMKAFGIKLSNLFFGKDIQKTSDSLIMWLEDLELNEPDSLPKDKQLKQFIRKLLHANADARPTSHAALQEIIRLQKLFDS